jgi:hypothetical protein
VDSYQFDDLMRSLASSRRSLVAVVTAIAASWQSLPDVQARKRNRKRGKARPNAYGCLSVGAACKSADQCCSGICEGKKGKRTCRAHGTATCDQRAPGFCTSSNPVTTFCGNTNACACFRTTAGSNFCGTDVAPGACAECKKDADCAALGFPIGFACVPWSTGICAGICATGMFCMAPCGHVPPDPES